MAKEGEIDSPEELDARISVVRDNLRELIAQASGHSGATDEDLFSQRIVEQEAQLEKLTKRRARIG